MDGRLQNITNTATLITIRIILYSYTSFIPSSLAKDYIHPQKLLYAFFGNHSWQNLNISILYLHFPTK